MCLAAGIRPDPGKKNIEPPVWFVLTGDGCKNLERLKHSLLTFCFLIPSFPLPFPSLRLRLADILNFGSRNYYDNCCFFSRADLTS